MAAEPVPRKGHQFKAVHGKTTSSLFPVANLAITAQHLPHFRARQHLHSVSSDTPAGCANTATCRSRVPTPSQSAGSWLEWGAPWSASSGLQSCFTLLTPLHSRAETHPTPPHCPEEHHAPWAPSNPYFCKPWEPDANTHNQELRRVESPTRTGCRILTVGGAVNRCHSHDSHAAEKHNSSPWITTNNLTLQIINLFGKLTLITTAFRTVSRKAMMTWWQSRVTCAWSQEF